MHDPRALAGLRQAAPQVVGATFTKSIIRNVQAGFKITPLSIHVDVYTCTLQLLGAALILFVGQPESRMINVA